MCSCGQPIYDLSVPGDAELLRQAVETRQQRRIGVALAAGAVAATITFMMFGLEVGIGVGAVFAAVAYVNELARKGAGERDAVAALRARPPRVGP